jgi:GNAT superfamily N-acetyltransferase
MESRIVPFEPSHLEPVVQLSLRAWEPVFDSIRATLEPSVFDAFYPDWRDVQRRDVTDACNSSEHGTFVLLVDEIPAGFVDITRADPILAEIHMLAVDPAYQGRGFGRQLTEFAVERMREAGAAVAMVQTGGDPGHASARYTYEAAGFRLFPAAQYFKKL